MKFNLALIPVALILFYVQLHAQYVDPYVEDAIAFKQRKILYVEDFFQNDTQRDWFKKYWKFEQEIRFANLDEIKELIKEKNEEVAILSGRKRALIPKDSGNIYLRIPSEHYYFVMAAYLPEKGKAWKKEDLSNLKKLEVAKYSIHHYPLYESEILFFCQYFHHMISHAAGGKGVKKRKVDESVTARIKSMKLLIPETRKSQRYWHEPISEVYPYSIEIATVKEIDDAILEKRVNTAYLRVYYSPLQELMGLFVIDCASGEVMLETGFKTIRLSPLKKENEFKKKSNYNGPGADESLIGANLFVQKKHLSWISQSIMKAEKRVLKRAK